MASDFSFPKFSFQYLALFLMGIVELILHRFSALLILVPVYFLYRIGQRTKTETTGSMKDALMAGFFGGVINFAPASLTVLSESGVFVYAFTVLAFSVFGLILSGAEYHFTKPAEAH
ncbi:Uncharacterised protein [uncultured archaeon]|nr:Uncharacterised protein [uncultured archaeon]